MFVDDIEIAAIGFADDAETEGDWTSDSQAFIGEPGAGWVLSTGTFVFPHYYIVEWRNLASRPQSSNAAFNTWGTYPFQEGFEEAGGTIVVSPIAAQTPVDTFTDELGWVPGIEVRLDLGGFYFRDQDASVVVPSVGIADYDWRVVWPDGMPVTDFYGGGWGRGVFFMSSWCLVGHDKRTELLITKPLCLPIFKGRANIYPDWNPRAAVYLILSCTPNILDI